jgi:hypothetical protein
MRLNGIIRALFRERQPFAVLAILAALLPYVLSGAGLHSGSGGIRLADGSFVICTSNGFQRIADPAGTGEHDLNDCCKSGCIHAFSKIAIGPAPAAQPMRVALASDIVWAPFADPAHRISTGAAPSIRAPPAASA